MTSLCPNTYSAYITIFIFISFPSMLESHSLLPPEGQTVNNLFFFPLKRFERQPFPLSWLVPFNPQIKPYSNLNSSLPSILSPSIQRLLRAVYALSLATYLLLNSLPPGFPCHHYNKLLLPKFVRRTLLIPPRDT